MIIVTTLDTFTSLMAGCTIFGILGNLAHEMGTTDISTVVRGGTGLAFISYPDALSRFTVVPQLFAVLFFVMMFVLGVGSAVALSGAVFSILCDHFPNVSQWKLVLVLSTLGFVISLVYVTPVSMLGDVWRGCSCRFIWEMGETVLGVMELQDVIQNSPFSLIEVHRGASGTPNC